MNKNRASFDALSFLNQYSATNFDRKALDGVALAVSTDIPLEEKVANSRID